MANVRIAVLVRPTEHYSLVLYRDNLFRRLPAYGIDLHEFGPGSVLPTDCDILWDPGLGMRNVPDVLFDAPVAVVATVLGLRSFNIAFESTLSTNDRSGEFALKTRVRADWLRLGQTVAAVITISKSCANDVVAHLGVPKELVYPIYLAVDRTLFAPNPPSSKVPRDYLFHISLGGLSRKNIARMIEAYEQMPGDIRIPFLIKCQEELPDLILPCGVKVVPGHCSDTAVAQYYRGARCLVFPSVYEGFGLPILEAMSCGCAVITSNSTACAEVAGDAALLVDPLSMEAIAKAMNEILRDDDLALNLAVKGLRRANQFDWDSSASAHARLFGEIANRPLLG